MDQPRRSRAVVAALYVNAALLGGVLLVLVSRGNPNFGMGSPAFAAPPQMPSIAGGNGVFLMPAQFSLNTWGCYLLDTERQTMAAYQFLPGEKQLRFVAARGFRDDLDIKMWNTSPAPNEVKRLSELQQAPIRGKPPVLPGDAEEPASPPPAPAPGPGPGDTNQ